MKTHLLISALFVLSAVQLTAQVKTKNVLKNITGDTITESIGFGSGKTLTMANGSTITAPRYLLNNFTAETLTTGQAGMGWDENGYFTIGSSAGWLQIYEAGDPLENTIHFAGRITADALEAASITGDITGQQVASGVIPGGVMTGSMTRPMLHWQNSATYAGANGLTYDTTGPGGQTEPQSPAMYFAGIEVIDGDPNANYLQGRIRSASQVRSDLGLVISTNVMPWVAASTAGNVLTSNGSTWVSSTPASGGGGKVLQMVYATKTDTTTGTSSSYTTVFSGTITPTSATSKIVATLSGGVSGTTNYMVCVRIARGSTAVLVGDVAGNRQVATTAFGSHQVWQTTPVHVTVVDSPGTTSAVTYNVQALVEPGGTWYWNRGSLDSNLTTLPRTASTLVLTEVAP